MSEAPDETCRCGGDLPADKCCVSIINGERRAVSALELMRSRYTAYGLGRTDYLLSTWSLQTRPEALRLEQYRTWTGLEILDVVDGRALSIRGTVEFVARFRDPAGPSELHERSDFVREAGEWVYLGGVPGTSDEIG